jgi:hypothetical protein
MQEHLLGNQEWDIWLLNNETERRLWPWPLVTEVNMYVLVIAEPSLRREEYFFVNVLLNCYFLTNKNSASVNIRFIM